MQESEHCKYTERLPAIQNCNELKCNSTTDKIQDPKVDLIQNDTTPGTPTV